MAAKTKKSKVEIRPKKIDKKKPKGKKHELKVVNGKTGNRKKTGKKIVVIDQSRDEPKLHAEMTARLAEIEVQIQRNTATIGVSWYEVGCALKIVRDDKLWRAANFKNFSEYLDKRKHVRSRVTAYNLIAVAEMLTREQAGKWGPSVSYLIAKEKDTAARQELMALAGKGATVQQVTTKAAEGREKRGAKARSPGRPKTTKRAVVTSNGAQVEKTPEVPTSTIKGKQTKGREVAGVESGETGILGMQPTTPKLRKQGFTHKAVGQIGENGPKVAFYVDLKKGLLKYRVI